MTWKRWSYMDHWITGTPQGPRQPTFNRNHTERYLRQLETLGFTGFDTFGFTLPIYASLYGSVPAFERALQDHGFVGLTGVFAAYPYATDFAAPHRRETHDRIFADFERTAAAVDGLAVENVIVMPTNTYFQVEPVTDETIKITAELWNRVGAMLAPRGLNLTCHFEFWGAIRTEDELALFFEHTDPELVGFFCDTAQHTIAGVDPLALFRRYRDRCRGFHFKDTQRVDDFDAYRTAPDAELMATGVPRWFYEMGTPEGLVDFPALMREILDSGFDGWLTVEHDKADLGGGNFAEATAVAKWYIDNVLDSVRGGAA
ncbi:sugar phosphate isomerase/epimerase family protein [Amnibacterium flavum]|uniref:Sugar phosphate isomerase n=1 Tax=Amnibacterium flavum TaxID=2173173 RepID=A0A2V1HY99_9MICO|nr:sugar phosphate isomerase/epimerase [Amnibacterium flavum]PVZ95737.1 sugar phosphate isomerase [Amnibacterium flavum]